MTKTKLFISYSRRDRQLVEPLYAALAEDETLKVFRDTDDILPTEEWKPRLEALIRESDTIIFALSPASTQSAVCQWELEFAQSLNKRIIPVVVREVEGNVPEIVSKLNYIFLTENDNFEAVLPRIRAAIDLDIDWIREHTRLGDVAARWEAATRLGAQPLRGKELEAAEIWMATQPKDAPPPTQAHRAFIVASRKAETKRQRLLLSGALIAMVIVGVLGGFALLQRNVAVAEREQAQITESQFLTDEAERFLAGGQTAQAIETLVTALPTDTNAPARPLLQRAFSLLAKTMVGNRTTQIIRQGDARPMISKFFNEGEHILVGDYDGNLEVVAARSGQTLRSLAGVEYIGAEDASVQINVLPKAGLAVVSAFANGESTTFLIGLEDLTLRKEIAGLTLATQFDIAPKGGAWSQNERFLIYQDRANMIQRVDLQSFETVPLFSIKDPDGDDGMLRTTSGFAVSDDGQIAVAGVGYTDTQLIYWSAESKRPVALPIRVERGAGYGADDVSAVLIDQARDLILVGTETGTIHGYRARTGQYLGQRDVAPAEILGFVTPDQSDVTIIYYMRNRRNQRGANVVFTRAFDHSGAFSPDVFQRSDQKTVYDAAICPHNGLGLLTGQDHVELLDLRAGGGDRMSLLSAGGAYLSADFTPDCTEFVTSLIKNTGNPGHYVMQTTTALPSPATAMPNPFADRGRPDTSKILHSENTGINGASAVLRDDQHTIKKTAITFFAEDDKDFARPSIGLRDLGAARTETLVTPEALAILGGSIQEMQFIADGSAILMSSDVRDTYRWWLLDLSSSAPKPAPLEALQGAEYVYAHPDIPGQFIFSDPETFDLIGYDLSLDRRTVLATGLDRAARLVDTTADSSTIAIWDGEAVHVVKAGGAAENGTDVTARLGPFAENRVVEIDLSQGGRFLAVMSSLNKNNRFRDEVAVLDLQGTEDALMYDIPYSYSMLVQMAFDDTGENLIVTNAVQERYAFPVIADPQRLIDRARDFVARAQPLAPVERCRLHMGCETP